MAREIVIYADESEKHGPHYANFYGGAAVESQHLLEVEGRLADAMARENLFGEIKWQKVTSNYLEKYKRVVREGFSLVREGKLKLRVMFTHRYRAAGMLSPYHEEHTFHILYYQFIKHAFGLSYCNDGAVPVYLRLYFDRLPDTKDKNAAFKGFIAGLERSTGFRRSDVRIRTDQIAEVDSHEHPILQFADVVLGSMQFRLNDLHLVKAPGARTRGKRTIAKEKLYKLINQEICTVYPRFNIGITTGDGGDRENRWRHGYRHWCFTPRGAVIDPTRKKSR